MCRSISHRNHGRGCPSEKPKASPTYFISVITLSSVACSFNQPLTANLAVSWTMTRRTQVIEDFIYATPSQYPTRGIPILILICLVSVTSLMAIDTTIISVAIPDILAGFSALSDLEWYGSA